MYRAVYPYTDRVKIRSIRGYHETAYLRGSLILQKNEILYCSQILWRFGKDRGIYSKELVTKSDNVLSRNFNFLFEKYFKEAYPEYNNKWGYRIENLILPLAFSALLSFLLTSLVLRFIDNENWFSDYISSFIVACVMYGCTKFVYHVKRKIFII